MAQWSWFSSFYFVFLISLLEMLIDSRIIQYLSLQCSWFPEHSVWFVNYTVYNTMVVDGWPTTNGNDILFDLYILHSFNSTIPSFMFFLTWIVKNSAYSTVCFKFLILYYMVYRHTCTLMMFICWSGWSIHWGFSTLMQPIHDILFSVLVSYFIE